MQTNLGSLLLELRLDTNTFNKQLEQARKMAESFGGSIEGKLKLSPKVDHTELHKLNKHLDLKQRHFKEVNQYFQRNKLTPQVDFSELDKLEKRLDAIEKRKTRVNVSVSSSGQMRDAERSAEAMGDRIGKKLEKAISKATRGKNPILGVLTSIGGTAIEYTIGSVFRGAFEGVGREISRDLGKGISNGLSRELSYIAGSFDLVGREIGAELVKGILDALGQDAGIIEKSLEDILGKQNIAREGAAVRGRQSRQNRQTSRDAYNQAQKEFEFVKDNMPAINKRGQKLQRQRGFLQDKGQEIQGEIDTAMQAMGSGRIQKELDSVNKQILRATGKLSKMSQRASSEFGSKIDAKIDKIIADRDKLATLLEDPWLDEEIKEEVDNRISTLNNRVQTLERLKKEAKPSTEQLKAGTDQFNALKTVRKNLESSLELIENSAKRQFQGKIDSLKKLEDQLLRDERSFGNIVGAVDRVDLIKPPANMQGNAAVKRLQNPQSKANQNISSFYKQVVDQVAKESGIQIKAEDIPALVPSNNIRPGAFGNYTPGSNSINIPPDMLDVINEGRVSKDQMETLVHELRHAVQSDFGRMQGDISPNIDLIKPGFEESRKLGGRIESSVKHGKVGTEEYRRAVEADAYTFAERTTDSIFDQVSKSQAILRLEKNVGVGGGILTEKLGKGQVQAIAKLQEIAKTATVDIQEELIDTVNKIEQRSKDFAKSLNMLRDVEILPVEEIEDVQDRLKKELLVAYRDITSYAEQFAKDVAAKPEKIKTFTKEGLMTLGGGDLTSIARNVGADDTLIKKLGKSSTFKALRPGIHENAINQLIESSNPEQLYKETVALTRQRAQQRLARQERLHDTMQIAGAGAGAMVRAGHSVANSPAMASFAHGVQDAGKNAIILAKNLYQAAEKIESVVLMLTPYGHGMKALGQHVGLPLLAGTAMSMTPVGGALTGGLTHLAGMGTGVAGDAALGAIQGGIGSFVGHLPGFMQGAVGSALSGAAQGGIEALTGGAASALGLLGAGKAAQTAVTMPIKAIASSVGDTQIKGLPAAKEELKQLASKQELQMPLRLPSADKVAEMSAIEVRPNAGVQKASSQQQAIQQAKQTAQKAGEVARSVVDATQNTIKGASEAVQQAERIAKGFRDAYASLKDAIDSGDARKAQALLEVVKSNATNAAKDISDLAQSLGDSAKMGTKTGNQLNNRKSQISKAVKNAEAQVKRMKPADIPTDVIDVQSIQEDELLIFDDLQKKLKELFGSIRSGVNDTDVESMAEQILARFSVSEAKYGKAEEQIRNRFDKSQVGLAKATADIEDPRESLMSRIQRAFKSNDIGGFISDGIDKLGKFGGAASFAIQALVGFSAASFVVPLLQNIGVESLNAAKEMEQLDRIFTFAYGSMQSGADAMSQVRSEAKALGLDLKSALQGQAQLAAATRGTNLEGVTTEALGKASRQATAVMGLDPQAAERVQMALQQMASKGKISAEELRQQLGESLPGAFQIAARAMGVTTQELDKMMERGELLSEDFLPKFAAQLSAETSTGLAGSANTAQAAINRFNTSVFELQTAIGKSLQPAQKLGLGALSVSIDVLNQVLPPLIQLIGTAAVVAIVRFVGSMITASVASTTFSGALALIGKGVAALKGFLTQSANSFAGWTVGVFAAIQVVSLIQDRFSNLGGYLTKFADDADAAFKRYQKGIDDINKKQIQKPTSGGSSFFGSLVPNMPGGQALREGAGNAERSIQQNILNNPLSRALMGGVNKVFGTELKPGTTFADVQAQEQQQNRTRLFGAGRNSLLSVKELLNGTGGSQLQQMISLDSQLKDAQSSRRALLPGDTAGRQAIDKQIEDLQRQRERLTPAIANVQAFNASMIETMKAAKEQAFKEGDMETYKQASELLDQLIAQQNKLNVALQGSIDPLGRLNRAFADIQGTLNSALRSIDQTLNSSKRSIAAAQINGATPGQLEFARSGVDIRNMQQRLGANQNAIQSQSDLLMNDSDIKGFSKAITDRLGVSSLMDLDPAQVSAQVSALSDSVDKDVLTKFNEEYERLLSLKSETDNLSTQIAEAKAQAVQRMRDLATSVYDLYRSIDNQSKELALQTEQIQLQAEQARIQINTQSQQNKLKQALSGFSDSFLNDFVDNLINLVDQLNKPLEAQNQLDQQFVQAQQQMLQAQQQYGDQIRQIYGLSNQLPDQSQLAGITSETPGAGQIQTESQASNAFAKENSNAQPGGFSPMALVDPADIERQVQAQLAAQQQNQSLTTGGVSGGNIPGLDVALDNPQAVKAQMDALRGLTPQDAMNAAQNGLSESAQKAYQNYTQQLKNIQTQYDTASAQAQAQIEQSSTEIERLMNQMGIGLRNVNRQIADTTRGFSRSIEDLQNEGMSQTAFGQLGGQLRGYDRGAEDQTIQLQRFREQLVATIDQAGAAYDQISGQIASGLMPAEEGQALLSGLTRTAGNAQIALFDITGQMKELSKATAEASQRAIELFKRQQSLDMNAARAESLRLRGLDSEAQASEFGSRANQLGYDAQQQKNELQALYDQGLINNDQFKEMSASLEQLNNLKLDNLRQEFKNLSQDKTFSALFGEKADRRSQRQNLSRFRDNLQDALQSGSIGRDEYRRLYRMSTTVGERFIGQSDTQRIRTLRNNRGNRDVMSFLQNIGVGNAGDIANLANRGGMDAINQGYGLGMDQSNSLVSNTNPVSQSVSEVGNMVSTKLDKITQFLSGIYEAQTRDDSKPKGQLKANNYDMALKAANL